MVRWQSTKLDISTNMDFWLDILIYKDYCLSLDVFQEEKDEDNIYFWESELKRTEFGEI